MNWKRCFALGVAGILVLGSLTAVQSADEPKKPDEGKKGRFGRGGMSPEVMEKLKLTDEQKKKAEEAIKEIAKAREANDKDAMKAAIGKFRDVLTDDQKKQLDDMRAAGGTPGGRPGFPGKRPEGGTGGGGGLLPPGAREKLKLTPEQDEKLKAIGKEMQEKAMGVLTDEQKKTLEEMKKDRGADQPRRPGAPDKKPGEKKEGATDKPKEKGSDNPFRPN